MADLGNIHTTRLLDDPSEECVNQVIEAKEDQGWSLEYVVMSESGIGVGHYHHVLLVFSKPRVI